MNGVGEANINNLGASSLQRKGAEERASTRLQGRCAMRPGEMKLPSTQALSLPPRGLAQGSGSSLAYFPLIHSPPGLLSPSNGTGEPIMPCSLSLSAPRPPSQLSTFPALPFGPL